MKRLISLAICVAGCSSSSSPTTTDASSTSDTGGPMTPAKSCVKPGDKGNEKGVGTPCTPLGKECEAFASTAPICLADVGQDQWMCTRVGCAKDADCGTGATCFMEARGAACVPNRCLDKSDAGSDSSSDSASDAKSD